jgi:hypothetical protein
MKVIKTAGGKKTIKLSKKEWESIGKKAGWHEDDEWYPDTEEEHAELDRMHNEICDKMEQTKADWVKEEVETPKGTRTIFKQNSDDKYGIAYIHTGTEDGPLWTVVNSMGGKVGNLWAETDVEAMLDAHALNREAQGENISAAIDRKIKQRKEAKAEVIKSLKKDK